MKKPTRVPVTAPKFIEQALKRTLKTGGVSEIEGINVHAPREGQRTWRVRMHYRGRAFERTATGSFDDVYAAVLELRNLRAAREAAAQGAPEHCFQPLADVLERYIQQGGPQSAWKNRTMRDRRKDLHLLIEQARAQNLLCVQIVQMHVRSFINDAAATAIRGKHLRGIVLTFMRWGVGAGYFTFEQLQQISTVQWTPPIGVAYRKAKSRREQSEQVAAIDGGSGGQVMTTTQLNAFAEEVQSRYEHGRGLVHVSACLGTRAQETLIMTASASVARDFGANFVDVSNMVVRVDVQVNDDLTQSRKTTKNGRCRVVCIPANAIIPSGFDLEGWLRHRCAEALLEQSRGTNPLALIFPGAKGACMNLNNLNTRVIRPATDALGWKMPGYRDARGRIRYMRRFTLHSLRDYFAVTAVNEWGYTPVQLLQQGSWADMQTVNKYYIGTTDETALSVKELHDARRK